jgi:hypothetical protein
MASLHVKTCNWNHNLSAAATLWFQLSRCGGKITGFWNTVAAGQMITTGCQIGDEMRIALSH